MTTPRIEEIKAEFQMFVPEDDGSAMDWLENILAETKNAGIDEAVEVVESMERGIEWMQEGFDKDRKGYTKGYNQALDDTIKALQDNK